MKKMFFAIVGMLAVLTVGGFWLAQGVLDIGLWGLWFAALNGIIGLYAASNVVQKNVISKNYVPELGQKR